MTVFQPFFVAPANGFLAALPTPEFRRLVPHLEETHFLRGDVLFRSGQTVEQVYFFDGGLVSLLLPQQGSAIGLTLVGPETVLGSSNIINHTPTQYQATVQIASSAWTMPATIFKKEFARGGKLQELVIQEMLSQHQQVTQQAYCYASHTAQQRLSSRLLEIRERNGNSLEISPDFLHQLAGDDHTAPAAIAHLREIGAIHYQPDFLQFTHEERLESGACSCYRQALSRLRCPDATPNRYQRACAAFEEAQLQFAHHPRA
jgi:CRP-like cAMP-binding protein